MSHSTRMPPAVLCENAAFGYPGNTLLAEVSLRLPGGSFTLLTGDNGAGKTTFLRTLCGFQPLLQGVLRLANDTGDTASRPRIGIVGQRDRTDDLYLFSGYEIALGGARLAGTPGMPLSRDARHRVDVLLEKTGATSFAQQRFSTLSRGQRQRIFLARALALDPDILVLDEPTAGVDTTTVERLCELFREIHATGTCTLLLATHEVNRLNSLATHRLHLGNGAAALTINQDRHA